MEQGEASENVQQIPSYELQYISQEPLGIEPRSSTAGIHQQQIHLVQVGQQQEEEHPESASNKRQQDNEENTLTQIQDHSNSEQKQEIHKSQHQSREQQTPESEKTQILNNSKPKVEHYLESQIQESQNPKINESQEYQMQQNESQHQDSQKPQAMESQEHQMQQNLEATTHSSPMLQSQQISTPLQVTQALSSAQLQEKQSTQHNESGKPQQSQEKSEQWFLTKQSKKRSRKLVGENQQRINYLVQASKAIALTAGPSAGGQSQKVMAAEIGSLASAVGRRCVLRLSPALKRCLCKGCGTALVYGVNTKVRHRSRRQKHLVVTCLTCRTIKRFINNPRHELWYEQEKATL